MSKSYVSTQPYSVVDPQWYLSTYPDVAASGMDPQRHYEEHGMVEGRMPRLLKAYRLESAMWGGFSGIALPELKEWHEFTQDSDEHSYASWALARWYASASQWETALPYAQDLSKPLPPFLRGLGPLLLRAEVLIRNGRQDTAQQCIKEEIAIKGTRPDLCLAAANVLLNNEKVGHESEAAIRLFWLNKAFAVSNLQSVKQRDPEAELTIDNIESKFEADLTANARPKISVIMPAYNAEQFIQTALRSLLAQSWGNLEILVVDDCSTDATSECVAALARQDKRIILLQQPVNRGSYAARNLALQNATGIFVVNHDSDDWSHPQRLELMVRPLIDNPSTVATMADWVRADTGLHFQIWRIDNSLVEPSVSTLMTRTEAVRNLGGWDEVLVAADHEMWQRLLRYYGLDAVMNVYPGTPLVIARQLPQSLTMATGTHIRSTLFGLRQLYSLLADTWHTTAKERDSLRLIPGTAKRAFPAPAPILKDSAPETQYDWLLIGDFSDGARNIKAQKVVLSRLLKAGGRIALFHWPDYERPSAIRNEVLTLAVNDKVTFVLAEQTLFAPRSLVIGQNLLAYPVDRVPIIKNFYSCQVVDSENEARLVDIDAPLVDPSSAINLSSSKPYNKSHDDDSVNIAGHNTPSEVGAGNLSIEPYSLFDPVWYSQRYPDVQKSGIKPWEHYVTNGYAEGREPGPHFNTAWYLVQCPEARNSGLPPLIHYENVGRHAGYDPSHPTLTGSLLHRPGRPTILLCAHAADMQLFGAERSLLDVLDACNHLALNVVVSVPTTINLDYIEELRGRALVVACIPTQSWAAGIEPCLLNVQRFRSLIRTHSVDLVQANTLMLREPLIAARQEEVPAVLHAHESPAHDAVLCATIGLTAEEVVEQTLKRTDHVLANSAFTAEQLAKAGATHVISNIIDSKAFDIPNVIDNKHITAALISSNLPKKGIQDLLQLAIDVAKDTPNLQLLLIGPKTASVAALEKLASRGQLPSNFSMVPYTPTPQAAISHANIVLNLSHCQETFGRTLLEGMAASRPVLAYRWGALPELIDEGVNGHTFEYGDTKAIANRLRQLCRNPKKIRTLGAAGRKRAKQFNLKRMCRQLSAAYESILGHPLQITSTSNNAPLQEGHDLSDSYAQRHNDSRN